MSTRASFLAITAIVLGASALTPATASAFGHFGGFGGGGFGHAAATSDSHSAHVTVGIHVYTWASVLKEFDPACVRLEEFRLGLPPGFASRIELRLPGRLIV